MADQTIWSLSSFEEVSRGASDKIQDSDLLIISKCMTPNTSDFVTVKLRADELSSNLYNIFYPKLKDKLSSSTDYDLKKLAQLDTLPGSLIENGTVSLTEKVTGYKGLALSNEVDLQLPYLAGIYNNQYSTDLKLSALAHVDKISLSNSTGLFGKLPLVSIDCEFGDLLTATWKDLDLSALAHRNNITEAHVVGTLDFPTKIRNYTDTLDERYLLSAASRTSLGGMKTGFSETLHNTDKNYAVKLDSNSNAYVHIPWTDTTFTLPAATRTELGGVKTGYKSSGRNYAVTLDILGNAFVTVPWSDTQVQTASETKLGGIKTNFTSNGKNYAVKVDSNGNAYVTIPQLDAKYGLQAATTTTLGGVKVGFVASGSKKPVQLDGTGNAFVDSPTPIASNSTVGGFKTGYASSGRNYAVQISDGKAFVYVPWTDTNTTYTAGTGIKITGTTISLANPTPASSIKYSGTSSIQVSGIVYNKSVYTKSVSYSGKNYTMYYDSWTAGNDCIVTVYVSLPMNISSCGTPCKREIYLQPSGGSATSIYSMTTTTTRTMPLILKAGDTIQITGACSLSHGTTYQITGTYLNRS